MRHSRGDAPSTGLSQTFLGYLAVALVILAFAWLMELAGYVEPVRHEKVRHETTTTTPKEVLWGPYPDAPSPPTPSLHDPHSPEARQALRARADRSGRVEPTAPSTTTPAGAGLRGGTLTAVESTAYCLTGSMANGQKARRGAVAMGTKERPWPPLGSLVWVKELDQVFVVEDRIGHGSQLDFAMPGSCQEAKDWGRRTVHVIVKTG